MGFFDLNIPYTESNKRNPTNEKSTRLKVAVKAMELGYTGIAYNRTIAGIMSELDRCSISLFPLSSVLKVAPTISSSVNLHRKLLDVPTSTPFRQYTRLTVVVDAPSQGSSLNSGNPVLKTYDIVAVRPLKQESFDQACKNYEVDIIAVDFSENRFRLKQPLIKAAIERGVYFEITYSGLITDAQLRRQMISNAKLLVDWTRGKNLIFSSAAPSVTELRGPYDVANLACLLGFSMEHAKAAVSRTCRCLLEKALRKKKFFKEAIRVELITSSDQNQTDDWLKWDPISSGEGDLQLDDMAKSFAKESKTVKPIDFVSIIEGLPPRGLLINDIVSETKADPLLTATNAENLTALFDIPKDHISHSPPKDPLPNLGNCDISSENEKFEALDSVKEGEACAMIIEKENDIPNKNLEVETAMDTLEKRPPLNLGNCDISPTNENLEVCVSCPDIEMKIVQENVANGISSDGLLCASNEVSGIEQSMGEREFLFTDEPLHEGEHMRDSGVVSSKKDVSEEQSSTLFTLRCNDELQNKSVDDPLEDDNNRRNHLYAHESSSERFGRKKGSSQRSNISFPFKRLLKPSHFKKVRKLKTKATIL